MNAQSTIKNNLEGYFAWLAGDGSMITADQLQIIQDYVFSAEADEIHSTASTKLGATA